MDNELGLKHIGIPYLFPERNEISNFTLGIFIRNTPDMILVP